MTKGKARELCESMIDYFIGYIGDIRRDNVMLSIEDSDQENPDTEACIHIDTANRLFHIGINMTPKTPKADIEMRLCHEIAHLCNWENKFVYEVFIDGDFDESENSFKVWYNSNEAYANRMQYPLHRQWTLEKMLEKAGNK